ncbi:MAG: hypothetical protein HRU13_02245 [Phycisphaerales bacterium]|nr:hypothetical protein [Phycisphaerales bacterium]
MDLPQRAEGWLPIEMWLTHTFSGGATDAPARAWGQLADWLGRWVHVPTWLSLNVFEEEAAAGDHGRWLEVVLDCDQQLALLGSMRAALSLSPEVLEGITHLHHVINTGGCECRACAKQRRGEVPTERDGRLCRYKPTSPRAWGVWSCAAPLMDDPVHTQPWWVYQVAKARAQGQGRAHIEREEKQRQREAYERIMNQVRGAS